MILFWNVIDVMSDELDVILKWIILPVLLLVITVIVAKNDYFGKGKWLCIVGAAISYLTVPYTRFLYMQEEETATFTFKFPNITYMVVGIVISMCGLGLGILWNHMLAKNNI